MALANPYDSGDRTAQYIQPVTIQTYTGTEDLASLPTAPFIQPIVIVGGGGGGASTLVIGGANPTPISGGTAGKFLYDLGTTIGETSGISTADGNALAVGGAAVGANILSVTGTAAISTSLAIGGATIGANALAVTGTSTFSAGSSWNNVFAINTTNGQFVAAVAGRIGFNSIASTTPTSVADTLLTRKAAASLQLGDFDVAAPIPQTIGPQSVVTGTSNTAGAVFTINDSGSTGSAASGGFLFRTTPAGGAGSTPNARATAGTLSAAGAATFSASVTTPLLAATSSITSSGNITATGGLSAGSGGATGIGFSGGSFIRSPVNGNLLLINNTASDFGLLQFGGTTSAFPALKRSTTSLQARLADDSAFTNIQGKLTTDTAYAAGTVVPTGVLTLYDSTGTAYRVPCLV